MISSIQIQIPNHSSLKPFNVFPNTVAPGADCTLNWKPGKEGYYMLQMFGQSGQAVYQRELWIDLEARQFTVNMPVVPAGSYFLRMTHKDSGKSSSEKIIIQ
jgi:hypothetical protein